MENLARPVSIRGVRGRSEPRATADRRTMSGGRPVSAGKARVRQEAAGKPQRRLGTSMKETEGRWWNRIPTLAPGQRHAHGEALATVPASGIASRAGPEGAAADLSARIGTTAFAFRGYDVENIGRTPELLAHPAYGPVVRDVLDEAGALCAEAIGEPVDLVAHVRDRVPTSLATFPQDVAMIVAAEVAQMRLLEEFFGVPTH